MGWTHRDILSTDPQDTLRVDLINARASEERTADVDGVYQSLEHERVDAELCRVLSELEVDPRGLAQDLHPFTRGRGSHRELRYRF